MDGKEIDGQKLYVSRAMKKEERQAHLRRQYEQRRREMEQKSQQLNLYIKNLDDDVDDNKLREVFSRYGKVVSAKVMREPATNQSKGFGFVSFESPEEVTKAVADMNTRIISQKPLYVALAQRKAERAAALAAQVCERLHTCSLKSFFALLSLSLHTHTHIYIYVFIFMHPSTNQ